MPIWETLDRHTLWQSRWYSLRQDRVRTPAGHEFTYTLVDGSGNVQPITTRPELTLVGTNRIIYTATGRLLGSSDRDNALRQSCKRNLPPQGISHLDGGNSLLNRLKWRCWRDCQTIAGGQQ